MTHRGYFNIYGPGHGSKAMRIMLTILVLSLVVLAYIYGRLW